MVSWLSKRFTFRVYILILFRLLKLCYLLKMKIYIYQCHQTTPICQATPTNLYHYRIRHKLLQRKLKDYKTGITEIHRENYKVINGCGLWIEPRLCHIFQVRFLIKKWQIGLRLVFSLWILMYRECVMLLFYL